MGSYSDNIVLIWAIVALYIGFIFVKGVFKAKRIHDSDDFLVAGRSVPWFLLFCTMGATVIGGGASIGAIGRTYDWGLLMLLVSSGWYLHFIFAGLFVAPKFREAKLYTVAGYFGHRFGESPRFVAMVLSLLFSVFIIAAQMAAFGTVLASMIPGLEDSGNVLRMTILVGGLLVIIYSTAGGLLAVIYTDIYQFVVLILGFFITLALCVPDLLGAWQSQAAQLPDKFFSPEGGKGWLFLITTFFAFLLGETFAPGYATRYCIGQNIRHTRLGITGVGIFLALTFPAVLFFIALYARIHFPDIDPQQALPMVVQHLHHPIIAALIIGALLSAVMSSADSALNSATAIFVKDLFEHQLGWSEEKSGFTLKLARLCSALLGVAAVVVAMIFPDIIGLLLFTYHVWAPAIILPVVVGVFSKQRSSHLTLNIFVTMMVATVGTLIYRFTPFSDTFDPAVFGVLLSCVTFFLVWLAMIPTRKAEA